LTLPTYLPFILLFGAGLGYGWVFMRTQRIEAAMAVHFGVNAVHFLLFTYPRLG
jgi:membrane protease YdiL (CAAX protease family)